MSVRNARIALVVVLLSFFAGPAVVFAQTSPPADQPAPFVQFLNILLQALVTAAAPILIAFVIGWVRQLMAKAKASVTTEQWLLLQSLAATVVAAAEQSGLAGQIAATGQAKKAWAISELTRLAEEHGLTGLDLGTLSSIIEGEVFRQLNQPVTPVPLVSVPSGKADA